jgi:GST-like protein
MSDSQTYTPPKFWQWENQSGGKFTNINRPTSGPTYDQELPVGKHPLQLYSLGTPNGIKITVLLEELLAFGHEGAEYDAFIINIGKGAQFSSGFVEVNPNSKIPALLDMSTKPSTRVFESGAIMLYLAERFGALIPTNPAEKAECMSWFFWGIGSSPYLGGGFGHFYAYAPEKFEYPINRFTMEVKRQLDVLDKNLSTRQYLSGNMFNISDIAVHAWYGTLILRNLYDASVFLDLASYKNVVRWAEEIAERPAYKRGSRVNRAPSSDDNSILERHDASDLD